MARRLSPGEKSCSRLIGLALEIPPAAYVAVTGHCAAWARILLAVWLSIWLLVTVIAAGNQQTT